MDRVGAAIRKIQAGKVAEGLEALSALADQPEHELEALGHRAWIYRTLGQYPEAISDYKRLARMDPENMEVAGLLAETHLVNARWRRHCWRCAGTR